MSTVNSARKSATNWFQRNLQGDPVIWFIVILLSLGSILLVYSATGSLAYQQRDGNTEHYLFRHTSMVTLSLLSMWVAHRIDYRIYRGGAVFLLVLAGLLLVYAFAFGDEVNEASRWLTIPFVNQSFQPSALAKLALVAYLAKVLSRRQHSKQALNQALRPALIAAGIICGIIALSNVSTAALLFLTALLLLFIGRVPLTSLLGLAVVGLLIGFVLVQSGQRFETAVSRLEDFWDAEEIPYQAQQSYIAIATGEWFGKGPGQSSQRNFLPYAYSDFIFAVLVEEYGLLGGLTVILLYMLLLYRGLAVASRSTNAFGGLLSAGLSFGLVAQALVNMAVAVGLMPITGQTLPLLSMGGTSLLFTGITFGIILSVSRADRLAAEVAEREGNNVPL